MEEGVVDGVVFAAGPGAVTLSSAIAQWEN